MSFFHIPEILDLLRLHLSNRDLTRFCLVSKTWNAVFTPYLWRSLPLESASSPYDPLIRSVWAWERFLPLIEADILYQQQHPHPEAEGGNNNGSKRGNNLSLPALSRNGRWVRTLGVYQHLLLKPYQRQSYLVITMTPRNLIPTAFTTIDRTTQVHVQRHSRHHSHNPKLTTIKILLHLFKRCPNIQSFHLQGHDKTSSEYYFWKRIIATGFPNTIKELSIHLHSSITLPNSTILPTLFARCPASVETLTLRFDRTHFYRESRHPTFDTRVDVVEEPLPSLKDLRFYIDLQDSCPPSCARFLNRCINLHSLTLSFIAPVWARAMERCVNLKKLVVEYTSSDCLELLATALTNGLPNLDTLLLRAYNNSPYYEDNVLAMVLSACHSEWKSLTIPLLGSTSTEALLRHCSMLTELEVLMTNGVTSQQLRQILSTSPCLIKFDVLVADCTLARILAEDFIDLDPNFDTLRPWPCETSLKVFRARIGGIPRPGFPYGPRERYAGQAKDVQCRVYERLARFIHLEQLALGAQDVQLGYYDKHISLYRTVRDEGLNHVDCLPMTLDSGLRILEGLTELREVNVMRMASSIGVEEVKWMVRSWPKLEAICGLKDSYRERVERGAAQWLKANHPHIRQVACLNYSYPEDAGGSS